MSFLLYLSTCTWEFLKPGAAGFFVSLSAREILDPTAGIHRPEDRSPLGRQRWCHSSPLLPPGRRGKTSLDAFVRDDWVFSSSVIELSPINTRPSITPSSLHASFKATLPLSTWSVSGAKPARLHNSCEHERWHITSGPSAYNGFFKCVAMFSWWVVGDLKCQTISLDNYCQGYYLRKISF